MLLRKMIDEYPYLPSITGRRSSFAKVWQTETYMSEILTNIIT